MVLGKSTARYAKDAQRAVLHYLAAVSLCWCVRKKAPSKNSGLKPILKSVSLPYAEEEKLAIKLMITSR